MSTFDQNVQLPLFDDLHDEWVVEDRDIVHSRLLNPAGIR
jgi:hypothetical protein